MPEFEVRKVQELIAYLLIYRQREHHREVLASLLWPDQSTQRAKKYLRKALWQLQNGLGECAQTVLSVENEWVSLEDTTTIWIDMLRFQELVADIQHAGTQVMTEAQANCAREAVCVYRGDLLEGWYEEWCFVERARLQHLFLAIQVDLMHFCEIHGNYEEGIVYGFNILKLDRAHERTHRHLMRLQYLSGDRTAALRQYQSCRAALSEELGVGPSQRTEALLAGIVGEGLPKEQPAAAAVAPAPDVDVLLSELNEMQRTLDTMRASLSGVSVAGS